MTMVAVLASSEPGAPGVIVPDVRQVLVRYLKFSQSDLTELRRGRIVKHSLEAMPSGEIAVVGAVRVDAPKARLLEGVRDITRFKRGPGVVQIGRFSNPPTLHDIDALSVDKGDFDATTCRVGECDVRLPADTIRRIPAEVDLRAPDVQQRGARWFKQVLIDHVTAYWTGTPGRFAIYDDGSHPIRPIEDFNGLVQDTPAIAALDLPLARHLTAFPNDASDPVEEFLYWSKEQFGMAPFITVTHVMIQCPSAPTCLIVSRDVYSSRYFDASLAMTLATDIVGEPDAFVMLYMNRSRSDALKGHFSGIRKAIAEHRARGSLEENLRTVKGRLEEN